MLTFYYDKKYKYTNRTIINVTGDSNKAEKDYETIDTVDGINGHLIYTLATAENIPTYIVESVNNDRRWFVSGMTQLRPNKFQISLMRDIVSEHPELWKTEEAYINAGKATNYNKYKTWGLPYTNTKVGQEKLTINGKSSFFVYYVNEQHVASDGKITEDDLKLNAIGIPGEQQYDYVITDTSDIPGYQYIGSDWSDYYINIESADIDMEVMANSWPTGDNNGQWTGLNYNTASAEVSITDYGNRYWPYQNPVQSNNINIEGLDPNKFLNNVGGCKTDFVTALTSWWSPTGAGYISNSNVSALMANVGKVFYNTTNNHTYRLNGGLAGNTTLYNNSLISTNSTLTLKTALSNITWPLVDGWDPTGADPTKNFDVNGSGFLKMNGGAPTYAFFLEDLGAGYSFDFRFPAGYRKLPKSAVRCANIVSDSTYTDAVIGQALMQMQANAGNPGDETGRILDVQYLPFSIASTANSYFKINGNSIVASILGMDEYEYTVSKTALTNINKETDSIKIVSPSRASQYMFKPYNNDGSLTFGVKISLKPYTSTIYIRPSTTGLLMYDWDDKDCLTISEDFSLTQLSSAWANYVYTNRNYQNAFNREIQGREFERSWERRIEEVQKESDEWSARNISAQKASMYTGNLPIIGNIASGIAASGVIDETYMKMAELDRQYNEAMYQESVRLARDQFNYQIDNLKSQPTMPSKVTTIDGKLLDGVYLEYYSTNPTELTAIENYYKYNGNRIDDYGKFADYWCWFVRGKIIRSQYYTQPEINELNARLNTGIFTGEVFSND